MSTNYTVILITVGLIGLLLIASPTLVNFFNKQTLPGFSELYLLGSSGIGGNYPYSIKPGIDYSVQLGISNHLGTPAYYLVSFKILNQTDLLPAGSIESPIYPIFEHRYILNDNASIEVPITFSFSGFTRSDNSSLIENIKINEGVYSVYKPSIFNENYTVPNYLLLIELHTYNSASRIFEFKNEFVCLQLRFDDSS